MADLIKSGNELGVVDLIRILGVEKGGGIIIKVHSGINLIQLQGWPAVVGVAWSQAGLSNGLNHFVLQICSHE